MCADVRTRARGGVKRDSHTIRTKGEVAGTSAVRLWWTVAIRQGKDGVAMLGHVSTEAKATGPSLVCLTHSEHHGRRPNASPRLLRLCGVVDLSVLVWIHSSF